MAAMPEPANSEEFEEQEVVEIEEDLDDEDEEGSDEEVSSWEPSPLDLSKVNAAIADRKNSAELKMLAGMNEFYAQQVLDAGVVLRDATFAGAKAAAEYKTSDDPETVEFRENYDSAVQELAERAKPFEKQLADIKAAYEARKAEIEKDLQAQVGDERDSWEAKKLERIRSFIASGTDLSPFDAMEKFKDANAALKRSQANPAWIITRKIVRDGKEPLEKKQPVYDFFDQLPTARKIVGSDAMKEYFGEHQDRSSSGIRKFIFTEWMQLDDGAKSPDLTFSKIKAILGLTGKTYESLGQHLAAKFGGNLENVPMGEEVEFTVKDASDKEHVIRLVRGEKPKNA